MNQEFENRTKELLEELKIIEYLMDNRGQVKLNTTMTLSGIDDEEFPEMSFNIFNDNYKLLKCLRVDRLRELAKIDNIEEERVVLFCDGSSYPKNPGSMGIGVLMLEPDGCEKTLAMYGGEGTNNRAELLATIMGIRQYPEGSKLEVRTDAMYVVKGMTTWVYEWIMNGYLKKDGSKVKNTDLWKVLFNLNKRYDIKYVWVKGHQQDEYFNSKADVLARKGATKNNGDADIKIIFDSFYYELLRESLK